MLPELGTDQYTADAVCLLQPFCTDSNSIDRCTAGVPAIYPEQYFAPPNKYVSMWLLRVGSGSRKRGVLAVGLLVLMQPCVVSTS